MWIGYNKRDKFLRSYNIKPIIRNLTREYKKIEPDCREGVRTQLERMKERCKERNNLCENQNDLKGQKQKIEKALER